VPFVAFARVVGGLVLCGAALLAPAPAALAIIDDTDGGPVERECALSVYNFTLQVTLVQVGLPIAGTPVTINATNAKLVGNKATAAVICEPVSFPLPSFTWQLAAVPTGQSASIANGGTLTPRVNLGGPGAYRIRLNPCPSGCRLTLKGKTRTVTATARETTINAVGQLTLPPETEPLLPPLTPPATAPPTFSSSQRNTACQGGGGAIDPQWVTAQRFNGPNDYRQVDGQVEASKVSASDNFLNHDSQDQNWDVKPDLPSAGLDQPKPSASMEMEWETNTMPREIRPTPGDRASTVGYWIFDCGHDPFKTEIHPPVGIATERARPVQIPSTFRPAGFPNGFGTNVQVPGIVADLFFNRKSGETTNNCSDTGLHQPSTGNGTAPCIREPHPLNRTFTFNVYLPRDPQQRAREAGLNPPPVPLFIGASPTPGLPGGGPEPTFNVRSQNGITWVEVSVNLTGLPASSMTYARRVSVAWAYPQTENWGAKRWRILLDRIRVGDDAEPAFDDGDWRFFFKTNNRDREWTKVFDCNECVDDDTTKALNVQTGGTGLGADPVLFPGQTIFVHTGGFDDETFGDDIGTVFDRRSQASGDFASPSQGGDGSYTLDYKIRPGPVVGNATLTPEARALNSAYTASTPQGCVLSQGRGFRGGVTPPRANCGPVAPAQRDPNLTQDWHPDLVAINGVRRGRGDLFESETEEFTLQGISLKGFKSLVASKRTKNPAQLNKFLAEMRTELGRVPSSLRNDYADLIATLDQSLPPSDVAKALPPGFRQSIKKPIVPIAPTTQTTPARGR
jgi:hypothetical protein